MLPARLPIGSIGHTRPTLNENPQSRAFPGVPDDSPHQSSDVRSVSCDTDRSAHPDSSSPSWDSARNNFGRRLDLDGTVAVVDAAFDAGINLIDTADIYGNQGGSETLLGEALKGRRDEVVLATKFGMDMGGANGPDWGARGSRRYIRLAVEASLRRLQTDWIDLYQYHQPDGITPLEETVAALDELVRRGQGPLHRLVELRGLAGRGRRLVRPQRRHEPLHQRAERLLAARPHGRAGAHARVRRPRRRHPPLLPARERPAHRQVPPGRSRAERHPHGVAARLRERPRPSTASRRSRPTRPSAPRRCSTSRSPASPRNRRSARSSPARPGPEQVTANAAAGEWEPTADDLAALDAIAPRGTQAVAAGSRWIRPRVRTTVDAMSQTPQPPLGGRYELRRQLATTPAARVYLAQDLELDRPVAIKVLGPELARDPADRREVPAGRERRRGGARSPNRHDLRLGRGQRRGLRRDGVRRRREPGRDAEQHRPARHRADDQHGREGRRGARRRAPRRARARQPEAARRPARPRRNREGRRLRHRDRRASPSLAGPVSTATYDSPEQLQGQAPDAALGPLRARRPPVRGDHRRAAVHRSGRGRDHPAQAATSASSRRRSRPRASRPGFDAIVGPPARTRPARRYSDGGAVAADLVRLGETAQVPLADPTMALPTAVAPVPVPPRHRRHRPKRRRRARPVGSSRRSSSRARHRRARRVRGHAEGRREQDRWSTSPRSSASAPRRRPTSCTRPGSARAPRTSRTTSSARASSSSRHRSQARRRGRTRSSSSR